MIALRRTEKLQLVLPFQRPHRTNDFAFGNIPYLDEAAGAGYRRQLAVRRNRAVLGLAWRDCLNRIHRSNIFRKWFGYVKDPSLGRSI